jgi:Kdo2-lipid IVA lauroyltransferase/acyltransferase
MFNKHRIEYFLFTFIGKLLSLFGFSSIPATSKIIAILAFYIFRIRRNVVIKNLTIAFPNLTSSEINSLALKNYQSIAITFFEIFNLKKMNIEIIKERFSNVGFDFIKEKYKENKGLILLTAHFGNWEMGALASGIYLKESINVLVKKQKNPYVADWLNTFRERFGNAQIFLGPSIRELYKSIKNKKIIGVVGDQRGKRDGVRINFFERETLTFPGTAAIAFKTKCPVIVMLCARRCDGTYEPIINELDYSEIDGTLDEQIQKFNQLYMSILEKTIRKYPEQWFWMHNIWKY